MSVQKTLGGWGVQMEYPRAFRRVVLVQAVWIAAVALALQLRSVFTFERLFVLWYVGFIVTVHLFTPSDPPTTWWRSVQVIAVLGFVGLCYFIVTRATGIVTI